MLRLFPALTLALLLGPVLAGLLGTLLPAFGYLPVLGGTALTLEPWRELFAAPGLWVSLRLALVTGLAATLLSLVTVVLFCAGWHGTPWFGRMQRLLSPLLSVPHVTVAFGLAFLLAPSGWLIRLLSPWATGFTRPPDWTLIQDSYGLALTLGLVIKEIPFLLLMTLAALNQIDAARYRDLARTLGYGRTVAWLKAVFPLVYPQLRLPIFAVLAYGVSVVDMALVLGPTTPPPLAVQLLRWFNDPYLTQRFMASSGAVLQLLLAGGLMLGWLALEWLLRPVLARWLAGGARGRRDGGLRVLAAGLVGLSVLLVVFSLLGLLLWSVAGVWRYPEALPGRVTLAHWQQHAGALAVVIGHTVGVGLVAAGLALLLTLGCLEYESRYGQRPGQRALWLLYIPLLAPQIAFLFGVQMLLIVSGLAGSWSALWWSHLVFVLPYVFLALADPYRAWDERYARTARCLGASANRVWLCIKLPMLLRPLLVALAVGFAVSVGQYLPTLFAGAGRFPTLTTEAVALAAGGDRRVIGVYALWQMLLPLLGFALALGLPAWLFRRRRGMQVTL